MMKESVVWFVERASDVWKGQNPSASARPMGESPALLPPPASGGAIAQTSESSDCAITSTP